MAAWMGKGFLERARKQWGRRAGRMETESGTYIHFIGVAGQDAWAALTKLGESCLGWCMQGFEGFLPLSLA